MQKYEFKMQSSSAKALVLESLSEGFHAITPAFGGTLAEAGAVCLNDQKHSKGVELKVGGICEETFVVYWQEVTEQMLRCWNDEEFTTEQAAYGIAILLIRELTEYTVIRRSRKRTGFDYWLGYQETEDSLPFQDQASLEVSGIRRGEEKDVKARVRKKLSQVRQSDHLSLPAYIVVVEFRTPLSHVVEK